MEFNIQDFLRDMREEQQQDHRDLSAKVDEVSTAMHSRMDYINGRVSKHDTRIVVVENTRKTLRWLGAALITALLTLLGDMVVNHMPHVAASVSVGEHK